MGASLVYACREGVVGCAKSVRFIVIRPECVFATSLSLRVHCTRVTLRPECGLVSWHFSPFSCFSALHVNARGFKRWRGPSDRWQSSCASPSSNASNALMRPAPTPPRRRKPALGSARARLKAASCAPRAASAWMRSRRTQCDFDTRWTRCDCALKRTRSTLRPLVVNCGACRSCARTACTTCASAR